MKNTHTAFTLTLAPAPCSSWQEDWEKFSPYLRSAFRERLVLAPEEFVIHGRHLESLSEKEVNYSGDEY